MPVFLIKTLLALMLLYELCKCFYINFGGRKYVHVENQNFERAINNVVNSQPEFIRE